MAQRKPEENAKVQQVLKLVDELAPEEQAEVLYQLKLQSLRQEIQKGIDSGKRTITSLTTTQPPPTSKQDGR